MKRRTVKTVVVTAVITLVFAMALQSINWRKAKSFTGRKNPVSKARQIKRNLERDVRLLSADARALVRSKNRLIQLKNTINSELRRIESTLRKTGRDINMTRRHVAEIDQLIRMF